MTLRSDTHFPTATEGLTNARTRIVGHRTGFFADLLVALVRVLQSIGGLLGDVLRRFASVVTPLGWTIIVLAPAALLVGYRLSIVEFVVAGYAGLVLVLVAALYLVGRTSAVVDLSIVNSHIVVGDIATGQVTVHNPGARRTSTLTIEVPIGAGFVELVVPGVPAGSSITREFAIPTARRGVIRVGPARTVRADPVGLVRRELEWTDVAELFVHPRTIGIQSLSTGLVRDLEGSPTRELTNSDVSFHALREYQPGDERRYIHWKSTAKTGVHMVRQFEETRRSHIMIALSLAKADYADDLEFELAVSVTGSLGVRAIRDVRDVSVVVSGKTPEFAKRKSFEVRPLSTLSRVRLLDELAVVDSAETALSVVDVARVASSTVAGVSVAFLVCGSATSASELRAASTKFPVGVEVIAVVCEPDASPGLRRVSGLRVLTIGYLDDLAKSLARAAAV